MAPRGYTAFAAADGQVIVVATTTVLLLLTAFSAPAAATAPPAARHPRQDTCPALPLLQPLLLQLQCWAVRLAPHTSILEKECYVTGLYAVLGLQESPGFLGDLAAAPAHI
jgi:hypothetical protein